MVEHDIDLTKYDDDELETLHNEVIEEIQSRDESLWQSIQDKSLYPG
jgi:hypothetical protein